MTNSSSVALTIQQEPLKALQRAFPRGTPFNARQLRNVGVSSALAHHYLKADWLVRLGRGVFMFPNDTLRREESLKFLSRNITGFHVGGKTALAWRGIRHNLPAREPLSLWGNERALLPLWFTQLFPAHYSAKNLFSSKLSKNFGLQPLPENPEGVLVSEPERALLEMLSEVGLLQGVEEARNIMEGARGLRPNILSKLLNHCQRVKVRLLCVQWAEELNLPWAATARTVLGTRKGQGGWKFLFKNGTALNIRP